MKKMHIALLILGIAGVAGMSFFVKDLTTQETFASAKEKPGKYVVVKTKLDNSVPIEYDALKIQTIPFFTPLTLRAAAAGWFTARPRLLTWSGLKVLT